MIKCQFFSLLLCSTLALYSQNVGINNPNPIVSFDIKGGIATRAFSVTPVGNEVNIPGNESFVIVGPGTTAVTCYAPTAINGQRLILFNAGGFNLNFLTYMIPPNEVREFICRSPGGWTMLSATSGGRGWSTAGNAATDTSINFIGTTDNKPLKIKINNINAGLISSSHLSLGYQSGLANGLNNTAIGDPLGMKYSELIPVLVKAKQELKEENEQYNKRIEKLEALKKKYI